MPIKGRITSNININDIGTILMDYPSSTDENGISQTDFWLINPTPNRTIGGFQFAILGGNNCTCNCEKTPGSYACENLNPTLDQGRPTISIPIDPGWNWISFPLENVEGMHPNNVLDSLHLIEGDFIKSSNTNSIYTYDGGWDGSLTELKPGVGYQLEVVNAGIIEYSGIPFNPSDYPITLNSGWNWIGFIGTIPMDINCALSSLLNPIDGDEIKIGDDIFIDEKNAIYSEGIGWSGELKVLEPGHMYQINVANENVLIYPNFCEEKITVKETTNQAQYHHHNSREYYGEVIPGHMFLEWMWTFGPHEVNKINKNYRKDSFLPYKNSNKSGIPHSFIAIDPMGNYNPNPIITEENVPILLFSIKSINDHEGDDNTYKLYPAIYPDCDNSQPANYCSFLASPDLYAYSFNIQASYGSIYHSNCYPMTNSCGCNSTIDSCIKISWPSDCCGVPDGDGTTCCEYLYYDDCQYWCTDTNNFPDCDGLGECICENNDYDCEDICHGDSVIDECGDCGGDGIGDGECDCDGNEEDCAGECGGSAIICDDETACNSGECADECIYPSIPCYDFSTFKLLDSNTVEHDPIGENYPSYGCSKMMCVNANYLEDVSNFGSPTWESGYPGVTEANGFNSGVIYPADPDEYEGWWTWIADIDNDIDCVNSGNCYRAGSGTDAGHSLSRSGMDTCNEALAYWQDPNHPQYDGGVDTDPYYIWKPNLWVEGSDCYIPDKNCWCMGNSALSPNYDGECHTCSSWNNSDWGEAFSDEFGEYSGYKFCSPCEPCPFSLITPELIIDKPGTIIYRGNVSGFPDLFGCMLDGWPELPIIAFWPTAVCSDLTYESSFGGYIYWPNPCNNNCCTEGDAWPHEGDTCIVKGWDGDLASVSCVTMSINGGQNSINNQFGENWPAWKFGAWNICLSSQIGGNDPSNDNYGWSGPCNNVELELLGPTHVGPAYSSESTDNVLDNG